MADDIYDRLLAAGGQQQATPDTGVFDRLLAVEQEPRRAYMGWGGALQGEQADALGKIARTAITGAAPGAVTARENVVNPEAGAFTRTIDAIYRAAVPSILQDPRLGPSSGPGLRPTIEQIRAAALKDPQIAKVYYEEWAQANAANKLTDPLVIARARQRALQLEQTAPPPTAPKNGIADTGFTISDRAATASDSLDILKLAQPPMPSLGLPKEDPLIKQARTEASQDVESVLGPKYADVGKNVFDRLSAVEAGPEEKFRKEHPWQAATAEIPGEAARMVPALVASSLAGGAGGIPGFLKAAATFDAVSQAQRIHAGGQKGWSPEQSAVNLVSMFMGAAAGGVAEKFGASKASQALAANMGFLGTPTALESFKATHEDVDWGELARSLYKGITEAALLSSAHLSAAHEPKADDRAERSLAREMADQHVSGDHSLIDTVAALEKAVREGGQQPPKAPEQPDPGEPSKETLVTSAVNAVNRANEKESTLRGSRDMRREALEEGMHPQATDEDVSAYDAMKALERDLREAPVGSANRLYLGSEEYADRIADQFGVKSKSHRELLREYGQDLLVEPHRKAARQGGSVRIRTTEEERSQATEGRLRITQEHQRVLAAGPERLREMTNDLVDRIVRKTGMEPGKAPFMPRTDPGIERAAARSHVQVGNLLHEDMAWERKFHELIRGSPHPETVNRIFTLAAMVGPEGGASIATKTLPEAMREPFVKALKDYTEVARKFGLAEVEAGRIPLERKNEAGELVGGFKKYEGHWVHQSYERGKVPKEFRAPAGRSVLESLSGPTPSSAFRRTKTPQEFVEQGIVKMEPTMREFKNQARDIHRLNMLNYLKAERPDVYLTKSEFEGNVEQTYLKQIEVAKDRIPELQKLIKAHTKEMAKKGLGIYAGESGPLTKAMAENRATISRSYNAHLKRMAARLIPMEGFPEGFDPELPGNRRRAREIRREQAKQNLLAKQLWTHLVVEREQELFGVKQVFAKDEVEANLKLRQLFDEKIALENIASSTWIQLKSGDMRFGKEHAGNYIRSDALRDISFASEGADNTASLYKEFTKSFKFNRVAGNPIRSFFTQLIGNVLMSLVGATELTWKGFGHWLTATEHAFQYLWNEGKSVPTDPMFHELVETSRVSGPLALYDAPAVAKDQFYAGMDAAKKAFAEKRMGDASKLWLATLARSLRYFPSQVPIFGKATRLVAAMDLIPQYAMYRQLRTGDGSLLGKLGMEEALTHTGYFYDMGDVPRWVQKIANSNIPIFPTFARFAYKGPTAFVKWMMASPPTVGTYLLPGFKVPPLFENTILENLGTPKATKAILWNKAFNLTLNVAKLAVHGAAASWFAAHRLGIDPGSPDYKKRRLAEAGGSPMRALFLLPYDVTPDGTIKFFDTFNIAPGTSVLSLGQTPSVMNGTGAVARGIQYALSLNWITSAGFKLATQTDFTGRHVDVGRSVVEAAMSFLPAGLTMPVDAAVRSMQPGSQKTLAEALFQALSGITLRQGEEGEQARLDLQQSAEEGNIKQVPTWVPQNARGRMDLRLYEANPRVKREAFRRKIEKMKGN